MNYKKFLDFNGSAINESNGEMETELFIKDFKKLIGELETVEK